MCQVTHCNVMNLKWRGLTHTVGSNGAVSSGCSSGHGMVGTLKMAFVISSSNDGVIFSHFKYGLAL